MALFNRPKKDILPFNKEETINEIIDAIENKYPDYCIIAQINDENPWDLLIIRSVMREIKYNLGNFGYQNTKHERLQQVFAISVMDPEIAFDQECISTTESWTTIHIAVSTSDAVMRKLEHQ